VASVDPQGPECERRGATAVEFKKLGGGTGRRALLGDGVSCVGAGEGLKENRWRVHRLDPNPKGRPIAAGQTVQTEVENPGKVVQLLSMTSFATTLDAADRLTLEEQEELADTLRRRIAEKRRAELVVAVKESRTEFARGDCKPVSVGAIMQRIRA